MISMLGYDENLDRIDLEFGYIRLAIGRLSAKAKNSFFNKFSQKPQDRYAKLFDLQLHGLPQEIVEKTKKEIAKGISKRFISKNRQPHYEIIQDGINASELLIRVALFEAFMKEIHRAILQAKPNLLATIHPDKSVKFQQLFSRNNFTMVLNEKIDDEVLELDRQKFSRRVGYFKEKLGISMGTKEDVKTISEAIDRRHEISHQNPFFPIDPKFLAHASEVMRRVPENCCNDAKVLYPTHFSSI